MTLAIVIITSIVSIFAFRDSNWFSRLLFNPFYTLHRKEYYRMVTHGFIHADWVHLLVNMFVLYSFGRAIENYFGQLQSMGILRFPGLNYLLLYFGGIVISGIPSLIKHKNHEWYRSVGASGGVSAVIFASIFFGPLDTLLVYFIPLPGIIFGILYLGYSQYMARRGTDNINHEAHFTGAVFGFLYPILIDPSLIKIFLGQLKIF